MVKVCPWAGKGEIISVLNKGDLLKKKGWEYHGGMCLKLWVGTRAVGLGGDIDVGFNFCKAIAALHAYYSFIVYLLL